MFLSHCPTNSVLGQWHNPHPTNSAFVSGKRCQGMSNNHSSLFLSLRSLSSMSPSLMPREGRREMTGFLPSPTMNTLLERVAKWWPLESLMWAMSKLEGCFSMCWRTPTLPMLLPPMISTCWPFSYLMRLSTSPVSRLSYKANGYI